MDPNMLQSPPTTQLLWRATIKRLQLFVVVVVVVDIKNINFTILLLLLIFSLPPEHKLVNSYDSKNIFISQFTESPGISRANQCLIILFTYSTGMYNLNWHLIVP